MQHTRPIDGTVCAADILPVAAHSKSGRLIAAHVHLNVTLRWNAREATRCVSSRMKTARWAGFPACRAAGKDFAFGRDDDSNL